jgi:hypothetical protein
MTTNFPELIRVLANAHVEFIIIGGAAARAHGSSRLTEDLDIVYNRTPENIDRLARVLAPYHPYLRGAPAGLPFTLTPDTIRNGLNFTLITELGALDLLGEVTGGGRYVDLVKHSLTLHLFGTECLCLGIQMLIKVKRAAGRPRDFETIAELEAILEEQHRSSC